ncbi:hypothetical protein [Rubritalea tangerina]|uniref:Uncharacterized protein n=1 Tax=Rubritalea tangerina TaxID=430798 RepID=A0ABW4Z6Z1_9BACT
MRLFLLLALSLIGLQLSYAGGKKPAPISITFHTEATNLESKKLSFEIDTPKGKRYMSKTPFIMTSDIAAYHATPSEQDPEFYKVSFQLKRAGASRLRAVSGQYAGKWIMCAINGRVVDMLYIDRQVDGRVITVWRGVDQTMLSALNQLVPRMGESEKAWKTRLKYENKNQ